MKFAFLAAASLFATPAFADAVTPGPLDAVAAAYRSELTSSCKEVAGPISFEPGFVQTFDLNGDGRPDAFMSTARMTCEGAASLWSGSGGDWGRWALSRPDGTYRILDGQYQSVTFETKDGSPWRARLGLHGSACDRVGAEPCSQVLAFNGDEPAVVEWPDGRGPVRPAALTTPAPAKARKVSWRENHMSGNHNGSEVGLGDDVIYYLGPKPSMRGVVEPGTVLVEIKAVGGERFVGTAYAFKKGCAPAPYQVSGALSQGANGLTMVLTGKGPAREGCAVVAYSATSPHARLVFDQIMSP